MTDRGPGVLTLRVEDPLLLDDTTTMRADLDGVPVFTVTLHRRGLSYDDAHTIARVVSSTLHDLIRARYGEPVRTDTVRHDSGMPVTPEPAYTVDYGPTA